MIFDKNGTFYFNWIHDQNDDYPEYYKKNFNVGLKISQYFLYIFCYLRGKHCHKTIVKCDQIS